MSKGCKLLCRSLGLTLLEAAIGKYPYDASGGPLQLMIQASLWLTLILYLHCLPLVIQDISSSGFLVWV